MIGDRNAGYEIIAEEYFTEGIFEKGRRRSGIALGRTVKGVGSNFVTWGVTECWGELPSYYWGHYFDSELDARVDYHERILNELRIRLDEIKTMK